MREKIIDKMGCQRQYSQGSALLHSTVAWAFVANVVESLDARGVTIHSGHVSYTIQSIGSTVGYSHNIFNNFQ